MTIRFAAPLLALGLAATIAAPAAAQTIPPPPPKPTTQTPSTATTTEDNSFDIAVGYSFLREFGVNGAPANVYPWGWLVTVNKKLGESPLKAVGEVTANYRHDDLADENWTLWGFLGGIRMDVYKVGNMQLFAQALAGAEHFTVTGFSETGFAFQPGGGIDLPFTKSLKARAQGDFRWSHQTDEDTNFKEFRFAASIVFGFK